MVGPLKNPGEETFPAEYLKHRAHDSSYLLLCITLKGGRFSYLN